jgi:hypothetical protein
MVYVITSVKGLYPSCAGQLHSLEYRAVTPRQQAKYVCGVVENVTW